ncbi:hypothetical protein NDN08_004773 [Rhodosorus marinus]|uniref:Ribonuclease P/MRP protein subunit POP5 n=1 Tax=Rhodosorus marinus TaxID=101924 RepID=A0AAV8UST4_9RHOD|nr:hypothetical protein NDN08_004773 [Rhodosorus marinus]
MVRAKNRYLVCIVDHQKSDRLEGKVSSNDVFQMLRRGLEAYFGVVGLGQTQWALALKYFDPGTRLALIRCARDEAARVRAALTLTSKISSANGGSVRVRMRVVLSSGTLKAPKQELYKRTKAYYSSRMGSSPRITNALTKTSLGGTAGACLKAVAAIEP